MRNMFYRFGLITLVLCCPLPLLAQESRTWTDNTGLFTIEAALSQIDKDAVKLKKTDGSIVTMPISKLSEEDQRFIAGQAAQNPFEEGGSVNTATDKTNSFTAPAVQAVDLSQTREASTNVPDTWRGEADPAPAVEYPAEVARLAFRFQGLPINVLPIHTDFFVSLAGDKAVIAFHVAAPGSRDTEKNFTRIFIGSTSSGSTLTEDTPLKLRPFGFSPDGKYCIFHQDDWTFPLTGKRTLLHITDVTSNFEGVKTFEPFAQLKRAGSESRLNTAFDNRPNADPDIYWAAWADNEHVLVQSESGLLILLNVNTGKAVWQTKVERRGDIALSPGRKYCFLPIGNKAVLCETMTGKAVGSIDDARMQKFRFSPSGKRFASCNEQGIILGDATTGTCESPFFVSGSKREQSFFWLNERFLFFGSDVVDTAAVSKAAVWTYSGIRDNVKLAGGYCWCVFNRPRDGSVLIAVTIPHTAMPLPELPVAGESALVLEPDVDVALIFEDSISEEQEAIRESMEKKITANGWVLAESAPISIVLKIEEEETDKVEYTTGRGLPIPVPVSPLRGPRGGGVPVEFKPERYSLSVMQGDKAVWSATHVTRPPAQMALDVVKDSSLQEVVDRAMEEHSYKKWLDSVNIPQRIARKPEGKGESRVTENGIEEMTKR